MQHHTIFALFLIFFKTLVAYEVPTIYHEHEIEPYNEIVPGEWILHIPAGLEAAKRIAEAEGFQNLREIPDLNLFHLYNLKPEDKQEHISIRLTKYEEITYMTPSTREKVELHQRTLQRQLSMRKEEYFYCAGPGNTYYRSDRPQFYNDPLYRKQWFLRNCSDLEGNESATNYDMKIVQTWEHFKLTGKGINVLVLDNGVYADHADLRNNMSMRHSRNYITKSDDPTPSDPSETHGTQCAGIIAAGANNGVCGVGVAPNATIGGQKFMEHGKFDKPDLIEAIKYNAEEVHIVSVSAGDGENKAFIMSETVVLPAFHYGINHGRQGKGILYVFASGNGKAEDETCSSDGGLQLIYKIIVGGAKNNGDASDYAEGCASLMAVTHSGNGNPYAHITPDIGAEDKCNDNFNGTSAGTPVAAGILALMLEANNNLSWRDVKHAIAWTSEVAPLAHNPGWTKNAAGFYVNFDLGFGLMNAFELVDLAKNWPGPTPPMNECVVEHTLGESDTYVGGTRSKSITIPTNGCKGKPQEINYIEHVLVTVTINHAARGFLQIMLTSPQRTVTKLLPPRPRDRTHIPIRNFSFMSVHNWGEQPQGNWIVEILDMSGSPDIFGEISKVDLTFYGTQIQPELYKKGPRKYAPFTLK